MAVIRKIKSGIKKIVQKNKKPASRQAIGKIRKKEILVKPKEEVLGFQEMAIEKTKFSQPQVSKAGRASRQDLPYGYGQDRITLQVRDPRWIHAYWEVIAETYDRLKAQLKEKFFTAKKILRVYDVSHIKFNGTNAHRFFDIEVGPDASNWYIDTAGPGRSWCVDLGFKLTTGEFIKIVRSNIVHMPLDMPSWITDEEWMIPEEMFARLYGMGFGLGQSSPVGKAWQERIKRQLFSGALASPGIASMASPVKKAALRGRKFWLVVNTELIVYGATEPDARVYVQDRAIKLRPDGTFTLRFALPDGKQIIPVRGVSSDNEEERTITPIVTKETK